MYQYEIYELNKICVFRGAGIVSPNEIGSVSRTIIHDERWQSGWDILFDYKDVNNVEEMDYTRMAVEVDKGRAFNSVLGTGKWAIVAPNPLVYGLFRMWQMLSEGYHNVDINLFKDLNVALQWLGIKDKESIGY